MTWVRFDDQASIHRKVAPLDDATYRLWHEAIEWCSRNLTDGTIRADELLETSRRATPNRAANLVARRLWHTAGDPPCDSVKCPPAAPDGWVIHDYLEYQPARERVKAELAAKAERTRAWRDRKAAKGPRDTTGDASRNQVRDASRNLSSDASRDAPVSSPRPAPPQKGGGGTTSLPAPPAADGGRRPAVGEAKDQNPRTPGARAAAIADAKAAVADARRTARRAPPTAGAFARLIDETTTGGSSRPTDARDDPPGRIVTADPWQGDQANRPNPNGDHPMDQTINPGSGTVDNPTDPAPDTALTADADAAGQAAEATQAEPAEDGETGTSGDHADADDEAAGEAATPEIVEVNGL